jgi:hypothetical protein
MTGKEVVRHWLSELVGGPPSDELVSLVTERVRDAVSDEVKTADVYGLSDDVSAELKVTYWAFVSDCAKLLAILGVGAVTDDAEEILKHSEDGPAPF